MLKRNCPSCNVECDVLKNGNIQFRHLDACSVGTLVPDYRPGAIGDFKSRGAVVCTKCAAISILSSGSVEVGSWIAPQECPLCWAEAEACRQ